MGIVYEAETGATLSRIDRPFAIRRSRGELRIVDPDDNSRIGEVNIGKTRISLRSFEIPEIEGIFIDPQTQPQVKTTSEAQSNATLIKMICIRFCSTTRRSSI